MASAEPAANRAEVAAMAAAVVVDLLAVAAEWVDTWDAPTEAAMAMESFADEVDAWAAPPFLRTTCEVPLHQ